jgi:flagellar assembly protein FliH
MATIISSETIEKHTIDKYNFKVLTLHQDKSSAVPSALEPSYSEESHPSRRKEDNIDASSMSQSSKDSLIESLLKKTDEMSSNFIKLQMKMESKEEEHKLALESVKQTSFAEGVEAGKREADAQQQTNYTNGLNQFSTSVATLESSAKSFEDALEAIKSQLISAALDIAKEVIHKDVSTHSQEIAEILSSELIKELQSASKVTLKVNPKDHGAISEHVGAMEHIHVISDNAVSEGGVIAISDAGNIDAQITKRFERVKKAALSEA